MVQNMISFIQVFLLKLFFWGKFWADLGSISLAKLIISNFRILNCRTLHRSFVNFLRFYLKKKLKLETGRRIDTWLRPLLGRSFFSYLISVWTNIYLFLNFIELQMKCRNEKLVCNFDRQPPVSTTGARALKNCAHVWIGLQASIWRQCWGFHFGFPFKYPLDLNLNKDEKDESMTPTLIPPPFPPPLFVNLILTDGILLIGIRNDRQNPAPPPFMQKYLYYTLNVCLFTQGTGGGGCLHIFLWWITSAWN